MARSPCCPRCGGDQVRASHYQRWEVLLAALFLRPRRCRACRHRFWSPQWLARLLCLSREGLARNAGRLAGVAGPLHRLGEGQPQAR